MTTFSPETFTVRTHDNVDVRYTTAGLGSRFLAQMLDTLITGVMVLVILFGMLEVLPALSPSTTVGTALGISEAAAIAVATATLAYLAYFALFEGFGGGRTPGKAAAGIRVVRLDGGGLTLGKSLIRNAVRLVDMLAYVGALVVFISPTSRRIGDYAAGTVVIRERRRVRAAYQAPPPPVYLSSPDPGDTIVGMGRLGAHELDVLRALLARPDIHPVQRHRVAAAIAVKLQDRMGLPAEAPERSEPPERFVERAYLQLERMRSQT